MFDCNYSINLEVILKEVWFIFEDPKIYDGYCATIYKDGTFELRDHWAVNKLSEERKQKLIEDIKKSITEMEK